MQWYRLNFPPEQWKRLWNAQVSQRQCVTWRVKLWLPIIMLWPTYLPTDDLQSELQYIGELTRCELDGAPHPSTFPEALDHQKHRIYSNVIFSHETQTLDTVRHTTSDTLMHTIASNYCSSLSAVQLEPRDDASRKQGQTKAESDSFRMSFEDPHSYVQHVSPYWSLRFYTYMNVMHAILVCYLYIIRECDFEFEVDTILLVSCSLFLYSRWVIVE